ncbi:MAG: hypothetical protein ACM3UZ_06185 [Acidobacteriota bacterium]
MAESKKIITTSNASGAVRYAKAGLAVMVVDVIDMSTTLEGALDAGAWRVYGASPDFTRAPVVVNPERIGIEAARAAREAGTGIIVVSEPRVGTDEERLQRCQKLMAGVEKGRGVIEAILPNLGAETAKLTDFAGRVVVAVTDTGGVAFDAAYQVTPNVVTGTVARTMKQKGEEPAITAARRALTMLDRLPGIAIVAASANSLEDILAARYIAGLVRKAR